MAQIYHVRSVMLGDDGSRVIRVDDSPAVPQALSTLSALSSSPRVSVRVVSPFSLAWDGALGVRTNLERAGCGEVVWRIGDGVRELEGACGSSTLIRWVILSLGYGYG